MTNHPNRGHLTVDINGKWRLYITSQACEGLRPNGPILMAGDDLAATVRRTLALNLQIPEGCHV